MVFLDGMVHWDALCCKVQKYWNENAWKKSETFVTMKPINANQNQCWWQCIFAVPLLIMFTTLVAFICLFYHPRLESTSDIEIEEYGPMKISNISPIKDGMFHGTANIVNDKVVSCYYNMPNPNETNQLMPMNIDPFLCTHINMAFASVVKKEVFLDSSQYSILQEMGKLKQVNPELKVLLSVGGAGNDDGFSDMVSNHASRKTFIRSVKNVLRNYSLDGIDLDWEFPGMSLYGNLKHRERQHFSQLLREIKMEYIREKRNYLLTVAVAAPKTIVDEAYDIDQLNTYVDYVNIMTYDFHYFTKFTPFTGYNSPLYARTAEQLYLATLNTNYTVHLYLNKGLDARKIVIGIPTYGHSFELVNAENPKVGSPAAGYGFLGSKGFVNYPDICMYLKKYPNETTVEYDSSAKVPYLYRGREWVSFDDAASVGAKGRFAREQSLRGAMLYSLNADDFAGACGRPFPLLRALADSVRRQRRLLGRHSPAAAAPRT